MNVAGSVYPTKLPLMTNRIEPDASPPAAVLFLLSSLVIGGSETKFVKLAGSLASRGARVVLAYLNPPEDLLAQIDPRVTVVGLQRRGKFSLDALRRLVATIRRYEVQAVVAVNLYAALYVALARLWLGWRSFRFLASVNTTSFVTSKAARRMRLYRHVLRRADVIVFGAQIQRRLWCELYGLGDRKMTTTVLYNGVDTERFAPRAVRTGVPQLGMTTRYVVGTVGALRVEKAQTHLIRATAELRSRGIDVGALIVGEGAERNRIETEIRRYDLQNHIALTGAASDVRPLLALMDVFVLPSIGVETFSNAALEAMAMGIPVVSSEVGGMEELLSSGGGVTYPPGDVARLLDLLADLLSDGERRREMGEAARRAAVQRFGRETMVNGFIALLPRSRMPLATTTPRHDSGQDELPLALG
jgi:glycosyltransferase involved in cell wall biosynthesis